MATASRRLPIERLLQDADLPLDAFMEKLFSQQLWCWGRDVKDPDKNLFLRFGYRRYPPPEAQKDCASVYVARVSPGVEALPRGFGMLFLDRKVGGLFLPRTKFRLLLTRKPRLERRPWGYEDLPLLRRPRTRADRRIAFDLASRAFAWIADYERLVRRRYGLRWREATLDKWRERQVLPADAMADAWESLSRNTVDFLGLIDAALE